MDKRFYRGVSLCGTVEVLESAGAKESIWRTGVTVYYKKGVTDPDYCVLKFTAVKGRYYSNFKSEDFEIQFDNRQENINMNDENELLKHIDELHTTAFGVERIKRNLSLAVNDDAVGFCKSLILLPEAEIKRNGKNWYININDSVITVNAYSYTIITAHKERRR